MSDELRARVKRLEDSLIETATKAARCDGAITGLHRRVQALEEADDARDIAALNEAISEGGYMPLVEALREPTHFEHVTRWHDERGLPGKVNGCASFEDPEYRTRRARLIAEEFCEAMEALGYEVYLELERTVDDLGFDFFHVTNRDVEPDPVDFLDALADMGVVIEGSASELGWDYDEARRRVQDSNDTKPKTRDEHGKIIKGDKYVAPELADLVRS